MIKSISKNQNAYKWLDSNTNNSLVSTVNLNRRDLDKSEQEEEIQQINPDWVNMEFTDIGTSMFVDRPMNENLKDIKVDYIKTAAALKDINLLCFLCKSREGLINNKLRALAWPVLLSIDDINDKSLAFDHDNAQAHPEESQVKRDVDRSFSSYPEDRCNIEQLRGSLNTLIIKVLRKHPKLSYYQGYHDIAQVVLLVFEDDVDKSFIFLEKLTLLHLRDYMMPTIGPSLDQLKWILLIIYYKDYNFFKILNKLEPYYSVSSIITLFSHDVLEYLDICYIFDYLLANNSSMIYSTIYLYAEILLLSKSRILNRIFENIYSKINGNQESATNSLTNSDILSESVVSNSTVNSLSEQYSKNTLLDASVIESNEPITESQYQKTSPLPNSAFFGYDDIDIEYINFDVLHNILANLVTDFLKAIDRTGKNLDKELVLLFEIFEKTDALMKCCPIYKDIETLDNQKTFGKGDCGLHIKLSDYSVLKNSSKFDSGRAYQGDFLEDLDHHYDEIKVQQKKEKEEQMRLQQEFISKKLLEKKRRQEEEQMRKQKNMFQIILSPLRATNTKLVKYFKHHKLLKVGVIIGVMSILLNIYLTNPESFSRFSKHIHQHLTSFGRSFLLGINNLGISDGLNEITRNYLR